MPNLSQLKRERMLAFLQKIKDEHRDDDDMLIALGEIESELTSKKYGLVWEQHEEAVDVMMRDNIPVFTEVPEREITAAPGQGYNFILEGDNLHSLRLLEKTHAGQIDLIYIDPPYNTGKEDFIYDDNYISEEDSFRHSKWLSFMEKRLRIGRRLLSERGVLFVQISDIELAQLKALCDEIFGESNYLNVISVNMKNIAGASGGGEDKRFKKNCEYILVYAKNYDNGTFHYYEGVASSYYGVGIWKQEGEIVTLVDDEKMGYPLVNTFRLDGDDLIFMEQGSSNFIYVKVEEGERFHLTGEAFKNPENENTPEPPYPFEATMEEITDQIHELQGLQTGTNAAAGDLENPNDPTMWYDGVSFDALEPNEEMVSPFEITLSKERNSVWFNITWARTGLTLAYGLRSSDGTEYCNTHAGGSGNGQFQNIPAGSYRLFVRNTDYSGVPAYENPDLFPYISFNATGAMNYKLD